MTGFIADVTDAQLSTSSDWNEYHASDRLRLNTQVESPYIGSWAALVNQVGEWAQVDLGVARQIERVATQGRNEASYWHNQWVTSYKIAYSDDGSTFEYILDSDGSQRVFTGNSDPETAVTNDFDSPIAARYFRLYPQTWNNHISMRWELYGCNAGKYYDIVICIDFTCCTRVCML